MGNFPPYAIAQSSSGGTGTPGGSTNQIQTNAGGGNFGGITISGVVAVSGTTGATTFGSFSSATLAAAVTDETGTGALVFGTAPTLSNPVVGTQSVSDNSTKAASTAFVTTAISNAVAGINPATAVQAATTTAANTSGLTYNNGVTGIGATFTGAVNTALTWDGFTFSALGQRGLVKNDTQAPSGAFNGIYYVTQVQTAILPIILTRALDYDAPSDINNTGAIPVVNGTVNGGTSWVITSTVNTVGTDPLTFTQFSLNPSTIATLAGVQTLLNKTFVTPALGTIASGNLSAGTGVIYAGNYGTVTDAKQISAAGNTTANSTTFTDTINSPFVSGDTGKIICINGAGYGSNTTTRVQQSLAVTSASSVSSTTQITFNANANNTVTFANGNAVCFLNLTGGLATGLATTQYYYLGSVTNVSGNTYTALLFTSPALTGNVTFVSTGTANGYGGNFQFVGTMTYVNATTVTLSANAGVTLTNTNYAYGTDNTTAINNAIAAVPATGGLVQLPAGNMMVNATSAGPGGFGAAANAAINISRSNIILQGFGQGVTTLMKANWEGSVIWAVPTSVALSQIHVRDLSATYAIPVARRQGIDFSCLTVVYSGIASFPVTRSSFQNVETYGDCLGININQNCQGCWGIDSYVHECLANPFNASNTIGGLEDCGYLNCRSINSGDSGYALDNPLTNATLASKNLYLLGCTAENCNDYGAETYGVNGLQIIGCRFINTTMGGIVTGAFSATHAMSNNVLVSDTKVFGSGTGTTLYGNNVNLWAAAFMVLNNSTSNAGSNFQFVGCEAANNGASLNVGPYIATYSPGGGAINNIVVTNFIGTGGATAPTGSSGVGQQPYGTNAGIDIVNGNHVQVTDALINGSYTHGINIGAAVTGLVSVTNPKVITPNSSAAGSIYALNMVGGTAPYFSNVQMWLNGSTVAGKINYNPANPVRVQNTFSAAGGFSNASIGGQTGNGIGATAWTLQSGNVTVNTTSNILTSTGTGAATFDAKTRDGDYNVVLVTAPTAQNQAFMLFGYANSTNTMSLDLYTGQLNLTIGSKTIGFAYTGYTSLASDTVRVILSSGLATVMYLRSGTWTNLGTFQVPDVGTLGTLCGVNWLVTTPTISQMFLR